MKERVFFEEFDSLYYFHGSSDNWSMQGFHFHNQYEIILFLTDGALLEVGNRSYNVKAGDIFLINNKEYHRTTGAEGKVHNRYVLMFDPELIEFAAGTFQYDFSMFFENRPDAFVHRLHLSGERLEQVEKLFGKIEQNINSPKSEETSVKLKLSILELITSINGMYRFFIEEEHRDVRKKDEKGENQEFKDPILYRERIEQIKKYIGVHVEERLDLDEISRKFYMNRYYLSHYFKKETGFTLTQYVANQKVAAAKLLLKEGHSVTDVSMRLSYNSDSHFIAVFKKLTGITPKKYAQSGKEQ